MVKPIDWDRSWTFTDYVISIFETKKTDSDEFQLLLRIYGREKLVGIWRTYCESKKSLAEVQKSKI